MGNNENAIEWLKNDKRVTLSLTSQRHISKLKKLSEEYPEECDIHINGDGSAYGHIPLSYIKISHPRKITEEQRKAAAKRLSTIRNKKEIL